MNWTKADTDRLRAKYPERYTKDSNPKPKQGRRPMPPPVKPSPAFKFFAALLLHDGLPIPVPELHFAWDEGRDFRFDFAWPDLWIALEVDGAVHRIKGRHLSDLPKFRYAAALGWTVYHVRPVEMRDGRALALMGKVLRGDREGALRVLAEWGAEK